MKTPVTTPRRRRDGFTLVEMLVALGIIILLAAIAVAFIPNAQEQTKTNRGADVVQQTLLIAKQWALRDRAPRGVQLVGELAQQVTQSPSPQDYVIHARQLRYIEQPDDFIARGIIFGSSPAQPATRKVKVDGNKVTLDQNTIPSRDASVNPAMNPQKAVDFGDGTQPNPVPPSSPPGLPSALSNQPAWPIQPGDYFQVYGGQVHRITDVYADSMSMQVDTLFLASSASVAPTGPTDQYRIIRRPRLIVNEKAVDLARDIVIDLSVYNTASPPPPASRSRGVPFDATNSPLPIPSMPAGLPPYGVGKQFTYSILFAPDGTVIGQGAATDRILMYVRDVTRNSAFDGGPILVGLNCRTGFISAYPVDSTSGNIYSKTFDPRASGM